MFSAMEFTTLPPEITSALIHSGPGAESLIGASEAWQQLGTDLEDQAENFWNFALTGVKKTPEHWASPLSDRAWDTTSHHLIESIAASSRGLNSVGMGTYPLLARSFWPAPIVLCRNAFTAAPT